MFKTYFKSLVRTIKVSTVTSGAKLSMIGETGWKPVVLEVNGIVSMKRIDMYIDHESSVRVCFAERRRLASASSTMLFSFLPVSR